jgi:hypothetical protein
MHNVNSWKSRYASNGKPMNWKRKNWHRNNRHRHRKRFGLKGFNSNESKRIGNCNRTGNDMNSKDVGNHRVSGSGKRIRVHIVKAPAN